MGQIKNIKLHIVTDIKRVYKELNKYKMSTTQEQIENLLRENLQPIIHLELTDKSGGCGSMYSAVIVSSVFEGKPLLQRHRLVNDILKDILPTIHAFEMKTWTNDQWEKQKAKQ